MTQPKLAEGQHAAPLVVTGAIPQTAPMPAAAKRYSPRLVNFAAHWPRRSPTRLNTPLCAPSTDRTGSKPTVAQIGQDCALSL